MIDFKQGDSTWHELRKRAIGDLYWFASVVLGYGDKIPMRPNVHLLLCKFIERKTGSELLDTARYRKIEMPRETGKSSLIRAYIIQRICRNRDISILLINEKELLAKDFLGDIKFQFENNELLRALFPELIPPDLNDTIWSATRIVVQRTTGRPDPTLDTAGVGAALAGKHPDLIVCDDMISRDAMENARAGAWQIMHQTNRWIHQLEPIVNKSAEPFPETIFVGCIAQGERVQMADGTWKAIETIMPGEKVWSWDAKARQFVAQRVTGVFPQGEAETVVVRTGHGRHAIRTTPNHPFLTAPGSPKDPGRQRWHRADWFKKNSPIQTVAATPGTPSGHSPDLCWLMGFLVGDGWVTKYEAKDGKRTTYSLCVARSVYPDLNAKVKSLLAEYFGAAVYETKSGYIRLDSNRGGRAVEALGLLPGVRAPEKRIPEWVWGATPEEKRAFLEGLLAADGFAVPTTATKRKVHGPALRLSSASRQLAEGARLLAASCGVRATSLFLRTRMSHAPNSPKPTVSTEYSVGFTFEPLNNPLRKWRVADVTPGEPPGERFPVWDLSVEGTENFICEGFVVHNTRWWFGDSYEHVEQAYGNGEPQRPVLLRAKLESGTQQVQAYRVGDLAVFRRAAIEDGQSIFPEKWSLEDLAKLRVRDPVLFSANYMNNPTDEITSSFKETWLKQLTWLDLDESFQITTETADKKVYRLEDLDKLILVDPGGFAERLTEDRARAAVVVLGDDLRGKGFFLDCYSEQDTYLVAIRQVVDFVRRYYPRKVYVERAGQQVAFAQLLRLAIADAGLVCTVDCETMKPGNTNKDVRILEMEPYYQGGNFYVGSGGSFLEFRQQYSQYPRAMRKDIIDLLGYWPRLRRKQNSGQSQRPEQRQQQERELARSRMATLRRGR